MLRATGAFLLAHAAALLLVAARPVIPGAAASAFVIGNAAWVAGSVVVVAAAGRESLTAPGVVVGLAQAAAVAVFAGLRWLGLRRAR